MKYKIGGKYCMAIMFLSIICYICCLNSPLLMKMLKTEIKAVLYEGYRNEISTPQSMEDYYAGNFYKKLDFVNIHGLFCRIIGQRIVNGAVKGETDELFSIADTQFKYDPIEEEKKVEKAIQILNYAKGGGCKVLYVQRPGKNSENDIKLPYGMNTQFGQQYDYWCKQTTLNGIPVLDLRDTLKEDLKFYKTDHHWTVESSFHAAKQIGRKINSEYDLAINADRWINEDDFFKKKYNESFLGSLGIKTGKYFAGKDDFEILIPKYNTDIIYEHYINGSLTLRTEGDFWDAFIDEEMLQDDSYNNKYDATLNGGYVENVVFNKDCDNTLRLLLISDSFARPMTMYLSLLFSETRYLDPRDDRYNDSCIEYIKLYEPDVVVMMRTGDFPVV